MKVVLSNFYTLNREQRAVEVVQWQRVISTIEVRKLRRPCRKGKTERQLDMIIPPIEA